MGTENLYDFKMKYFHKVSHNTGFAHPTGCTSSLSTVQVPQMVQVPPTVQGFDNGFRDVKINFGPTYSHSEYDPHMAAIAKATGMFYQPVTLKF
jgi:hypothetical protein